jgi:hypothetical protein
MKEVRKKKTVGSQMTHFNCGVISAVNSMTGTSSVLAFWRKTRLIRKPLRLGAFQLAHAHALRLDCDAGLVLINSTVPFSQPLA